jgi:microtubule-associated protein-like 6
VFKWQERDLAEVKAVHDGAVLAMAQRWGDAEGVVTGGNDGLVLVLDADLNTLVSIDLKTSSFGSLLPKPKSVCEGPDCSLLIGTKGGEIYEHSSGQVTTLMRGHYHQELWGLCVLSQSGRFLTAGQDGLLALWDPANRRQLAAIKLGVPACCCEVDYGETFLAVGLESGHLLVLNVADFSLVKRIADRKVAISSVKFAPSGQFMAVGAHDALIFLYNTADWTLCKRLKGHHSAILGMDFLQNSEALQSVSSSYELLYHNVATGKQDTSGASRYRDEHWASWSCTIGWPVQGIWPPFSNGSDINAVKRANSGKVVTTTDDFGKVKLFKYPCVKGGSAFNAYSGHSSHVTNVDFIGNKLISTGGMDKAVFQWRYIEDDVEEIAVSEGPAYSGAVRIDLELHFDDPPAASPIKEEKKMTNSKRKQKADSQTAKPWAGDLQASKPDLSLPPSFNQHPTHSLTLARVLGYRGFDSRHNLRVLANGDLVYPAAALAVVMSRDCTSQHFFQLHNDDVVSLAVHPSRTIVATGQVTHVGETSELPVYVWEAGSMRTLACLKGYHRRAVRTLAFSPDGTRLLTVGDDEDHSLAVYEWSSETLLVATTLDKEAVTGAIFTSSDTLVAAGIKMIKFITISGSNCTVQKGIMQGKAAAFDPHLCLAAHNGKMLAGTQGGEIWTWSGRALESTIKKFDCAVSVLYASGEKVIAAGANGTLLVLGPDFANLQYFNVKDFSVIPSVRSLDIDQNSPDTLILGMKSSEILELNIAKEYSNVRVLASGHGTGELWGLCAHPSLPKAASAGEDGIVAIWDLAAGKEERRSKPHPEGFRAVDWSSEGSLIVCGSVKGLIYLFTANNLDMVSSLQSSFKKGDNWIQAIRFSPSSNLVAFGAHSCASSIEIMTVSANVLAAGQVINIGLSSALTHLDWSADETTLVVNSQAYELKFVDMRTKTSTAASSVKDTVWASWTCVLGWPVEFIWPPYSDGSDINSCARSHNSQVLITTDDFGQVNLFRYPVVFPRQQRLSYKGHSSHVTNVAFSYDDRLVVSAGGLDKTILVWKTDLEYDANEDEKVAIVEDISSKSYI